MSQEEDKITEISTGENESKTKVVVSQDESIVDVNVASAQDDENVDQDGDVITNLNDLPPDMMQKLMAMLGGAQTAPANTDFANPLDAFASAFGGSSAPRKSPEEIAGESGIEKDVLDKNGPFSNKNGPSITEKGKNARKLACPFCCKSTIFLPKAATHVKKDIFMMYPSAQNKDEGEIYSDHWRVTSKMDFENIGVRRGLETEGFRYLTCSDCDMGPIGVTFDSDNNKVFYISDRRVFYR